MSQGSPTRKNTIRSVVSNWFLPRGKPNEVIISMKLMINWKQLLWSISLKDEKHVLNKYAILSWIRNSTDDSHAT